MGALKTNRKYRFIGLTLAYALVTAVVMYSAFYFIDARVIDNAASSSGTDKNPDAFANFAFNTGAPADNSQDSSGSPIINANILYKLKGIPVDAGFQSMSSDGRYYSYLKDGKLYVMNILSGVTEEAAAGGDIDYSLLMHDRNIIIYFSLSPSENDPSKEKLTVGTYNIDTKLDAVQKTLTVDTGSTVKQADYSSMTGHVYFNVKNGSSESLYYINMMKELNDVAVRTPLDSLVITDYSGVLYYEHNGSLFYRSQKVRKLGNTRTKLLGSDSSGNIYVQSLDDTTKIYVIKGIDIVKTIHLADTGFKSVYSDKSAICLVYPGHILDITRDNGTPVQCDKAFTFKGMASGHYYFSGSDGSIFVVDPK